MRNLKKLLAVIVAICVLATFAVPAFATVKTDAEIATNLGVIQGTGAGVTAEYLATQPDRVQGAIMFLRLKGLEAAAKAFIGTDNFADVEGLSDTNTAILAYLKANPDLGFVGVGDNKFAPLLKMTAKEYYKVLLTALGYTYGTDATADFTWANVFGFAASKGLTKLIDNEKFSVNDLSIGTVEALKTAVKGGTVTLIAKMVEDGSVSTDKATASGLYSAVPVAAKVVSATANNLKVATIVFDKEIDSATVNTTNVAAAGIASATLGTDKKTVYALFTNPQGQSSSLDITINGVKDTAGLAVGKTVKSVTFEDITSPAITGAVSTNVKTIVISASEPINYVNTYFQVLNNIKIGGIAAIGTTSIDYTNNKITLVLSTKLAAGTHKLDISGLKDYSGLQAPAVSFNVEVANDTTAPVVTSATMVNVNSVEVIFSEDIDQVGTFKINGTAVASAVQDSSNKAKFTLTPATALNIGAIVEVKVAYVNQTDVTGNKVSAEVTYTFKVSDDTALPTVTAAIASDNKITLTFSKSMKPATGTIKILKASDKSVISTPAWSFKDSTNKVIELAAAATLLNAVDPTDILVNIKDMTDYTIRYNALAEQNIALKTNDTKAPTVTGGVFVKDATADADDTVTFYFSEAMDTATLNNLSNYVQTSAAAGLTTGALSVPGQGASVKEIAADGKSITIKYPGIGGKTPVFTVYALKDVAGNMLTTATGVTNIALTTLSALSAKATAVNKIEVTFDTKIKGFDPSVFILETTAGTAQAMFVSYALDDTGTKATLTSATNFATTTVGLQLDYNNYNLATNIYGATLTSGPVLTITDGVAPTASVAAGTTAGSIVVSFSEVVKTTSVDVLAYDLVVKKSDGSYVDITTTGAVLFYNDDMTPASAAGFSKLVITNAAAAADYTVEILSRGYIKDGSDNKAAVLAATAVKTN